MSQLVYKFPVRSLPCRPCTAESICRLVHTIGILSESHLTEDDDLLLPYENAIQMPWSFSLQLSAINHPINR